MTLLIKCDKKGEISSLLKEMINHSEINSFKIFQSHPLKIDKTKFSFIPFPSFLDKMSEKTLKNFDQDFDDHFAKVIVNQKWNPKNIPNPSK